MKCQKQQRNTILKSHHLDGEVLFLIKQKKKMENLFSIYIRKKMEEVGVIAEYENSSISCQCADCCYIWFPLLKTGGKFYRNFWRCRNGCNKK